MKMTYFSIPEIFRIKGTPSLVTDEFILLAVDEKLF